MEDSNVSIRLKLFIDSTGLSSSLFADTCGIPRPSLSQLINGRNKKLSDVVVKRIHDRFPELSVLWLMFGEGEMLMSKSQQGANSSDNSEMRTDVGGGFENPNLIEFTQFDFSDNDQSDNKIDEESLRSKIEADILENLPKPKKVVSLTVFYDDNSYEVFYPGK